MFSKILSKGKHCLANVFCSIDLLDVCLKLRFHSQFLHVSERVNGFPIDELSSCQCLFCCQWLSVHNACSLITSSRDTVRSHKLSRVLSVQDLTKGSVLNFGLVSAFLALYEWRFHLVRMWKGLFTLHWYWTKWRVFLLWYFLYFGVRCFFRK